MERVLKEELLGEISRGSEAGDQREIPVTKV